MQGYVRIGSGCVPPCASDAAPRGASAQKAATAGGLAGERSQAADSALPAPAQLSLLYESRDKALCLFESGEGSLQAVLSARLA